MVSVTMERHDLTLFEWLEHAQLEALDKAVYLEKLKDMVKAAGLADFRMGALHDPR